MFVKSVMAVSLLSGLMFDGHEAENVAEAILAEVVEDIDETADESFNGDDVRIAMRRVIMKKILGDM